MARVSKPRVNKSPKSNFSLVILLVVCVVISIGVVKFIFSNRAPNLVSLKSPTPTVPLIYQAQYSTTELSNGQKRLESKDLGFQFTYPSNLIISDAKSFYYENPARDITIESSTEQGVTPEIIIMLSVQERNGKSLEELLKEDHPDLNKSNPSFASLTSTTINNAKGYNFQTTGADGKQIDNQYLLQAGENYVYITILDYKNGTKNGNIEQNIVKSFKVLE
jgi:hypothetical protein